MYKRIGLKAIYAMVLGVLIMGLCGIFSTTASATTVASGSSVSVVVNYLDEIITVSAGSGGSTKFYLSTDKQKNWELLEGSTATTTTITFDISSILKTKEVIIYLKGNKDSNPVEIKLQGEDKSLKATYGVEGGVGRIQYTSTKPLEYRKGTNGNWLPVNGIIYTNIYEVRGATLYFRTKATHAERAGKVVKVKIPKRGSAPSVKVDGSDFTITGMKPGMLYRLSNSNTWTEYKDTSKKFLSIPSLLSKTTIEERLTELTIEIRNPATDKKVASQIKVFEIPAQANAPTTASYNSGMLTITDATSSKPYEYTIVKASEVARVNYEYLQNASWKSVTSSKATKVTSVGKNTLAVGDYLYVRLRTTTDKTTKLVHLASQCAKLEVKN